MMLPSSCFQQLDITEEDLKILCELERTMPYYADLFGADLFIDCFYPDRSRGIVVAEARPSGGFSNYGNSVIGESVLPENEPAVFAALDLLTPVHDTKAVTQEQKIVRQDVLPLKNREGRPIGVLVCERDISENVRREQKFEALEKAVASFGGNYPAAAAPSADTAAMREVHHRIKNNLQMVASILNLQARRCQDMDMKAAFKENVNRILSIAEIYDILAHNTAPGQVSLMEVVGRIRRNIEIGFDHPDRTVTIELLGEDIPLAPEKATSAAIVVNELVANATEHAFPGRDTGCIRITLKHGNQYSVVTVADDGIGFSPEKCSKKSLGLELCRITVRERLHGSIQMTSDSSGTRIAFDFPNQ